MPTRSFRNFSVRSFQPGRLWLLAVACGLIHLPLLGREPLTTRALVEAVRGASGPAGFCVHVGCGNGALTTELAKSERLAIHALEANEKAVQAARKRLESVYGQAVVEQWTGAFLPFADDLVNVVVAENPGPIPESELLRIVAPLGTLWLKRGTTWQAIPKPWPKGFDEWTHARHGADGNMVSRDAAVRIPTGLRWVAGPAQDSGGQKWYYDHVLVSAAGRNFYLYEDGIVARDAFNGRLLWRRPGAAYTFKESGTPGKLKTGTRTSKVRPVAAGDRLYAALEGKLMALDARTGQPVQVVAEFEAPREIAVEAGTVLLSDQQGIRAFAPDGRARWHSAEWARRLVAGDGKVLYLTGSNIVCLKLSDGKQTWRAHHPKAADAVTCSYYGGVLVLERSSWRDDGIGSGVVVFSGDTGDVLWEKEYTPGMTHFKESRAFLAEGLVWLQVETKAKPAVIKLLGYDPKSGEQRRELGTRGQHCSTPIATEQYLIAAELEFTDLKTGEQSRGRMVKSACRLPFVPANGLLYTFPVQCECYPMLRGYIGLAQTVPARDTGAPRLQRGPAFGRPMMAEGALPDDAWPMYRRDVYRSGSSPAGLSSSQLKQLWAAPVAQAATGSAAADWADNPFVRGVITPPVSASGLLLVAVPDRHRIVALNAASGSRRWQYVAGGRVDTPPTIVGNRCVFGAHDGYVYCLSLADGELAWRLRAAPYEARIADHAQMESPWPVAGSVFAEGGIAYLAAGRHPDADGGMRVLAVRVSDGQVVWEQGITDTGVKRWYGGTFTNSKVKVGVDYEPIDLLVRDGEKVAMSRWQFNRENGEMTLAFARTNYQAFDALEVPRGIWGYGIRQNKLVLPKPPAVFNALSLMRGTTNQSALLLAGSTLISAGKSPEMKVGEQVIRLDAPVVHDGLIAAGGRLYAATASGRVFCFGNR